MASAGDPACIVRPIDKREASAYAEYVQVHIGQSGKNGMPVFAPGARPGREEIRDNALARWARTLTEPNWGRAWALVRCRDGAIVGHIELRGGRIGPEMHRATLAMGILQAHTRQGHGRRLMETALTWAREQPRLAWIDLGVFRGNEPARKLYERTGFVQVSTREDAFRADDGTSIDDVMMTLRIR